MTTMTTRTTRSAPPTGLATQRAVVALFLFAAALFFYFWTMQPSLAWGDGVRLQREAITAESFVLAEMVDVVFAPDPFPFARLGVAAWDHPLYVMLGHTLVQLFPQLEALWLVNAISAVFAAATVALLFWLLHVHTCSMLAALYGALALAVSHTFWWHAATPEVYTLFTFLLLLTLILFDAYERGGRFYLLLASAFTLGLGLSNHLQAGLALVALFLYLVTGRRYRQFGHVRVTHLFWLLLAFLAGLAPFLVQLVRMLRTFPPDEVLGPAVGATFLSGSLATTPPALVESLVSYLIFLFYQFRLLGVLLGLLGWWRGRQVAPRLWPKLAALYLVYLAFGLVYQVADQFAFFLAAHLFWAAATGLGVAVVWRARRSRRRLLAVALTAAILVTPLFYTSAPDLLRRLGVDETLFGVPQIGTGVRDGLAYYIDPNKRGDRAAAAFGRETLEQLPAEALVVAQWYTDTDEYFVLRYFAVVENRRPDVTILGWPLVDPFNFDPNLVQELLATEIASRPVYLASLSESFYAAPLLLETYCIFAEHNLYRVTSRAEADGSACLPVQGAHVLP